MAKTIKTRASNYKPLTRKLLSGDKRPGNKPAICFHNVDGDDKSDRGDKAVILVVIENSFRLLSHV